jgi:hypothetical protein
MQWDFSVYLGSPFVELSNVQQVSINAGRQALLDNFSAATATVTIRYPNGYTSPISELVPGTVIKIEATELGTVGPVMVVFRGFISDVQVAYGIPYAGGVGPADYLTINCESILAKLSRASGNGYGMAAATVINQLSAMTGQTNIGCVAYGSSTYTNVGGATVSGSWADWLNQLASTLGARLTDGLNVGFVSYDPTLQINAMSFSDSPTGNDVQFNAIDFDSLAQNYFTQITVDPESYAEVTVSNIPAGETARNYTVNTYSGSNGQASDLAYFYLGQFSDPKLGISALSVNMNDDTADGLFDLWYSVLNDTPVGYTVDVEFRGSTLPCIIEGFAVSATPQSQMMTFYVSDASLNNFLILDDATFGQLDYNRLGF